MIKTTATRNIIKALNKANIWLTRKALESCTYDKSLKTMERLMCISDITRNIAFYIMKKEMR